MPVEDGVELEVVLVDVNDDDTVDDAVDVTDNDDEDI